jgi:hypothetical protein
MASSEVGHPGSVSIYSVSLWSFVYGAIIYKTMNGGKKKLIKRKTKEVKQEIKQRFMLNCKSWDLSPWKACDHT